MTDAFGAVTWWGFSPAIDLQDDGGLSDLRNLKLADTCSDCVKILLVGAGDLRHVLLTIAKSYRHKKKKIHTLFVRIETKLLFYILENNLELYARNMLFLTLMLEPQSRMGLQEKTELFLELYGNILVRKQSEEYVEKMASEFIKMVTDFDYLEKMLPVLDLSLLKFKERDFLEAIFKFWRNPEVTNIFEVSNYWDLRQRKYLGNRYDTRLNVFDWDYQMRLSQREADIIHLLEYKRWRETGIAFDLREADYDVPNKTLASGLILKHDGEKYHRRGYWGDILVSPYVAFGIQSEEKSFFKKSNNQYTKTACNVAEYNVMSMFHEITYKTPYSLPEPKPEPKEEERKGPTLTEITEEEEEVEKETIGNDQEDKADQTQTNVPDVAESNGTKQKENLEETYEPITLDDVKISFLPMGSLPDMPKKSKYQKLFQAVYFSNSLVHLLKPEIQPLFADKACVIVESARYMLELNLDQVKLFTEKVEGMGQQVGCKMDEKINRETANFIKLLYKRSESG